MATCPTIKFGIPSSGAPEYNVNSGRELFRCAECVKLYVTNVSLEKSTVRYSCGSIMDAGSSDGTFCLQSANANLRDRNIINWVAKDNVTSALPNGTVITKVGECQGAPGIVYTHTEGSISVRAYMNVEDVNPDSAEKVVEKAKTKLETYLSKIDYLDYYLSGFNTNSGPTNWQSANATYSGIGSQKVDDSGTGVARVSFSWQNGKAEISEGSSTYDTNSTPEPMPKVIQELI